MKKILLLLVFSCSLFFAQTKEFPLKHEDFSKIIVNNQMTFEGFIAKETSLKLLLNNVIKNPEKPDVYFVSGRSEAEGNSTGFLGEMVFTEKYDVKGSPDQMLVFGDFYFVESKSGEHSGIFKGKFRIQTNKDLKLDEKFSTLTFKGKWKNYSGTPDVDAWWANYIPTDISKVVFK